MEITRRVFDFVDKDKISDAVEELLNIKGVGISRASKIIGLFDQERFCIYYSNVGHALKTLQFTEKPIIKCPAGRARPGDPCSDSGWAKNYQKLIWTLEIIRDYLNAEGYPFSIADIEIALFMMENSLCLHSSMLSNRFYILCLCFCINCIQFRGNIFCLVISSHFLKQLSNGFDVFYSDPWRNQLPQFPDVTAKCRNVP